MEIKDKIIVAKDFSDTPLGRDIRESKFSGETFLIRLLFPKFLKAVHQSHILEVDLSGIYGYPSSFISGSFGNLSLYLSEQFGKQKAMQLISDHLRVLSKDNPLRAVQTKKEIENPTRQDD